MVERSELNKLELDLLKLLEKMSPLSSSSISAFLRKNKYQVSEAKLLDALLNLETWEFIYLDTNATFHIKHQSEKVSPSKPTEPLQPTKIPETINAEIKPNSSSPSYIVKKVCPNPDCQQVQETSIPTGIRPRKLCKYCHQKTAFSLWKDLTDKTTIAIEKTKPIPKKSQIKRIRILSKDQEIIHLLIDQNLPATKIAEQLKINRSTISRRINKLVNENILIDLHQYPKFYKYNGPSLTTPTNEKTGDSIKTPTPEEKTQTKEPASEEKQISYSTSHKIQVKCMIESGTINPNDFTTKGKMTNWTPKYFQENNLNFTLTPKSILFWPHGRGITNAEVVSNAKMKAMKIKEFIETKYNCKLSFPEFKYETGDQTVHYVPVRTDMGTYEELGEVWTDLTPKGPHIESGSKAFVDKAVENNEKLPQIEAKLHQLEQNQQQGASKANIDQIGDMIKKEVSAAFNNFKIEVTQAMAKEVGTAVSNVLKDLLATKAEKPSGPAPDFYL